MNESDSSSRILTIPNVVSFVRLLGIPVFWWALLADDNVALAAWLVFFIGWTDWIDGYLARRLDQVSDLGKALDPIADRLLIASALVGGLIAGVLPVWFAWGTIAREVLVGLLAITLAARGGGTIAVRYVGKVATFLLYGAIPAFYLAEANVLEALMRPLAWVTGIAGLILYWYVAVLYIGDSRAKIAQLESADPQEV
ncbi:MAG: CDP-alcohol phosphatidyltransferase family protein [Acidimicrobiia bacterium]